MKSTVIFLMLATILSKVFGFFKFLTLSYFYGASSISDAYLISLTIPVVILGFIGAGISTAYIPMYTKIEQEYGILEGNNFTNNLINILILVCTVMIFFGLIFTTQLVEVFASGFEGDTLELAVRFTKISLFGMYFTGVLFILNGFLQIKGNYMIPAMTGLLLNIGVIISIILSSRLNILILSIGTLIATSSQLLLLAPFVYRKGYRYSVSINIRDKHIVNMLHIILPIIAGVSVNQLNTLVDRTLASRIAVGGISTLSYANKLNDFILSIFVLSLSTAIYPRLSKMAAENNIKGLKDSIVESISLISIFIIPATVGAMIFAEPIVSLLFGRGAFDNQSISMTSNLLFFYSIGMIGYGLREILARAFYSMQDTKTPMVNSVIGVILNIVLNIILSKYIGLNGLALATSISAIFISILLFISLRKKIGPFGIKKILISFLKILMSSSIMGIVAKLSFNYLKVSIDKNLSLVISIAIGLMTYFIIIYFMKIEAVDEFINIVKKKLKRRVE